MVIGLQGKSVPWGDASVSVEHCSSHMLGQARMGKWRKLRPPPHRCQLPAPIAPGHDYTSHFALQLTVICAAAKYLHQSRYVHVDSINPKPGPTNNEYCVKGYER
ncbi:hypothetical protein HBI64_227740 [Parastagonospora nodorum]|nr:hypothetical protein HBH47_222100 [Parastagonospora nodorum]KAH4181516.1 hypothetical protein HBH42_237160 [Parastagonospora nodorum]KAH5465611.1 hypothetical protein HBI28_227020 [Parastagonospora nodorum]KAH5618390.1 hypothetical protein HBI22_237150 [Parastagonospora nodorum]KAH5666939.1 hypothetical protein HBI21_228140 [Parastagonospora nodorum]